MKIGIFICLFILLMESASTLKLEAPSENGIILNRTKRICQLKASIENCYEGFNKRFTYYFYFETVEIVHCPGVNTKSIDWTLVNQENLKTITYSNFKNKVGVTIEPRSLSPGRYFLKSRVEASDGDVIIAECGMRYVCEPPVIIFALGRAQYVEKGGEFVIDITQSTNFNDKPLDPEWKVGCKLTNATNCTNAPDCQKEYGQNMKGLKFTARLHECFARIVYTCTVVHETFRMTEKHDVFAQASDFNKMEVEIVCAKNCDGHGADLSNPKVPITLDLKCKKNCDDFTKLKPTWDVLRDIDGSRTSVPFNEKSGGHRITINAGTLEYFAKYRVHANVTGQFRSIYSLSTTKELIPPICDVQPREGISTKTLFDITCSIVGNNYLEIYGPTYKVYQLVKRENGEDVKILLAESSTNTMKVVIPALSKGLQTLSIEGSDIFMNEFTVELPKVNVSKIELMEELLPNLLDNFQQLKSDGNDPLASKYFTALPFVLGIEKDRIGIDTVQSIFEMVLGYAAKFRTPHTIAQQLNTLAYISNLDYLDASKFKTDLSKWCSSLSEIFLDKLKKSQYNLLREGTVMKYSDDLKSCTDVILNNMNDDDDSKTPADGVTETGIKEEYPDYDDNSYSHPEIELIKNNVMKTILRSSQAIANTLAAGENYTSDKLHSNTAVSNEEYKDMINKTIEVTGAVVKPTGSMTGTVSLVVSSFENTFLSPGDSKISSQIVSIDFFNNHTIPLNNAEFNVTFDIADSELEFFEYTVTTPSNLEEWKVPKMDHSMNVHRLNLIHGKKCFIKFKTLGETDKFQVVITVNRRPNLKDFSGRTFIVDPNKTESLLIDYPYNISTFDQFVYVAVLPHKDAIMNEATDEVSFQYKVQFSEQECVFFDETLYAWMPANCYMHMFEDNDTTKLTCSCKHTSLFAAKNDKIYNKLDVVKTISFTTVMESNYIIFGHTLGVFLCFCFAALFIRTRSPKSLEKDKMFFLSDNLKNDRYAYLLIVKTGNISKAGTTANVALKLFGENAISRPHVLNYPDPDKRLLQRGGIDSLILTHDKHLGNLKLIHLWFDGVGLEPAWYCENISIIDLQTREQWNFHVKSWLSLLKEYPVQVKIETSTVDKQTETVFMNMKKNLRFFTGAELTWNIFSKTHDDIITFQERLTAILSIILTTYVSEIVLLASPQLNASDAYGYGSSIFYWDVAIYIIVSSLIASAINFPIVFIFRNAEKFPELRGLIEEEKLLPLKARINAWYFLMVWTSLCAIYLVIFGFSVTLYTSYIWMVSTTLSLLFSIFVVENTVIMLLNIFHLKLTKIPKRWYNFAEIINLIERQRKILFKTFGEVLLRPYFKFHYRQLTKEEISDKRQYENVRLGVATLFNDLCIFVFYILLVYIICLSNIDNYAHIANRSMRDMVENGIHVRRRYALTAIRNISDIYNYINITILNLVHPVSWYGRYLSGDAGLMADFNTKILGVVQLRQQRRQQVCTPPDPLKYLNIHCSNYNPVFDNWKYHNGSEITKCLGQLSLYNGEGYITPLGRTLHNSYFIVNLLKRNNWIDINTKVLFIEFWAYNGNTNLFHAVRVIIERDYSGHIVTSCQISTMSLLYDNKISELVGMMTLLFLFILIFVMTVREIVFIIKNRMNYFKSFWNILDIILTILSISLGSMYFTAKIYTKHLLNELVESNHNEFVNYFYVVSIMQTATVFAAFLLCLATIRLWKFLRFGVIFMVMERTLMTSANELLALFIFQFLFFLMFTFYISSVFGANVDSFSTVFATLCSLYLASLKIFGQVNHTMFWIYDRFMCIFYGIFMICSLIYLTTYTTIIITNFKASIIHFSNVQRQYNLKNYVIERTKYYKELFYVHQREIRLKGGAENLIPERKALVYPKAPAQRYANAITITDNKIRLMKVVSIAVIKNLKRYGKRNQLSEDDYKLMARIVLHLRKQKQKSTISHMFFKGKDPITNRHQFVDDIKMLQMEYVTKKLLTPIHEIEEDDSEDIILHTTGNLKRLQYFKDAIDVIQKTITNIKIISSLENEKAE